MIWWLNSEATSWFCSYSFYRYCWYYWFDGSTWKWRLHFALIASIDTIDTIDLMAQLGSDVFILLPQLLCHGLMVNEGNDLVERLRRQVARNAGNTACNLKLRTHTLHPIHPMWPILPLLLLISFFWFSVDRQKCVLIDTHSNDADTSKSEFG